jgi:hypothetical protein
MDCQIKQRETSPTKNTIVEPHPSKQKKTPTTKHTPTHI